MEKNKIHGEKHPLAGKTVKIKNSVRWFQGTEYAGQDFRLEDWWDRLGQGSWMFCRGNPACIIYALRSGLSGLPTDDEVVYGKIGNYGHLIHVTEIDSPV